MRDAPRGAPSDVVLRGTIKVDAGKALHKLRDHMLVDLHLWATEVARAAIALGASRIDATYDTDDVVLSFDGASLDADAVAHVRDHVLTIELGDRASDALRLLGIAVTAALGLEPSFVDVILRGEDGACSRIRFDKSYIDAAGKSAPPRPEPISAPKGMAAARTRVHVRHRFRLGALGRTILGDVPREIALLSTAMRDAPIPLGIGGGHAVEMGAAQALLRVDLDEPSASRAYLEVLAPSRGVRAETLFLEHGVRLAASEGIGCWSLPAIGLGLRILVDAPSLPTNASRSELRADAPLLERVRERVPRALETALGCLEAIVLRGAAPETIDGGAKIGHAVTLLGARPELLAEALGALAGFFAVSARNGAVFPAWVKALFELPLLADATGRAMTLARLEQLPRPIFVHSEREPVAQELGPWLDDVVWMRGLAAERALEGLEIASARDRIAIAASGYARRMRALEHPPSAPTLASPPGTYALHGSFDVTSGPFAGLHGEVAIARSSAGIQRSPRVRFFVDGHLLETAPLPGVSLPVDMALAWPDRIRARAAYDAVERDASVHSAVVYAMRVAAVSAASHEGAGPELVRLAIRACIEATRALAEAPAVMEELGVLAHKEVWPTSDPGVMTSLARLVAYARRTGALCVAPRGAGRALDDRPVLEESQVPAILPLLPEKARIVGYARSLTTATSPSDVLATEAASLPIFLRFSRPGIDGILGVGQGRARTYHAGVLLCDTTYASRNGPVTLIVDDRAAIPTPEYDGALYLTSVRDLAGEEDALVEQVVSACERGELDYEIVAEYLASSADRIAKRTLALPGATPEEIATIATVRERLAALPERAERARLARVKAAALPLPERDLAKEIAALGGFKGSSGKLGRGCSVTAVLPAEPVDPDAIPPAELFFEARPMGTEHLEPLPLRAFVDVHRDDRVEGWTALSSDGRTWARAALLDAALSVSRARMWTDWSSDVPFMRLLAALLESYRWVSLGLGASVRGSRWPTVQGSTTTLTPGTAIGFARDQYPAYVAASDVDDEPSPYDAPALHVPDDEIGDLRRRIVLALGHELRDVGEAIGRIQARRSRGKLAPPPRLASQAAHPSLRASLASLGVTSAEGEIELVPESRSEIVCVDARGVGSVLALETAHPIRGAIRLEGSFDRFQIEIGPAVEALLRAAAVRRDALAELPPFVRARKRLAICMDIERGTRSSADDDAPVFTDIAGTFHPLATFVRLSTAGHAIAMTTAPPPYPKGGDEIVLCLSARERDALASILTLEDVTPLLQARVRMEERRTSTPRERAELAQDVRQRCLATLRFPDGELSGEVGILAPAHLASRGIEVLATMRPLVVIDDGAGWPLVATVDAGDVATNADFDGLANTEDETRIRAAVRVLGAKCAASFLTPPVDTTSALRLPVTFLARAAKEGEPKIPAIGVFWLPRSWPEAPTVQVDAADFREAQRVPLGPPTPGAASRVLPACGRVYFACDGARVDRALAAVFAWLQGRIVTVVPTLRRSTHRALPREEIAKYEWDIALLEPASQRIRDQLASDRPDPLFVHVVARRAPELLEPATPVEAPEPASVPPSSAPDTTRDSLFGDLVRWIVEIVAPPPAPSQSELVDALMRALVAMKLTGEPVESVAVVNRGRPIRYEAATRRVLVNTRHPSIRALADDPARDLFLVAAAVSEVNRELQAVTDAEELAIVRDLLREQPR